MAFQPKGIVPAMVTPLTPDGKINVEALRKLTRYLIDGGVHGLFPVGSQGEFYALTFDEKKKVIEVVVEETQGRRACLCGHWSGHHTRGRCADEDGRRGRCDGGFCHHTLFHPPQRRGAYGILHHHCQIDPPPRPSV